VVRTLTYRPDIDGLRAFSVLAVVAFHLNRLVPGGYVGVDVFFVISGFLIGGIVFKEVDAGTFSFAHFYLRRIRRIAPALIVMLLAAFPASVFLTGPLEIVAFAKSSLAALFSVANIYFYATSGYFGPNALDIPLLHLWSLGIEEQFYIVFPLLVVVLSKCLPRRLVPCLVIGGLLSLLSSQFALRLHPEASFYLPQNRAFELTVGVLLARVNLKSDPRTAKMLAAAGVGLLAIAICFFRDTTSFPGIAALAPCAGAALVIWSGQTGTPVSRMLGMRIPVYLGKISYPLYLAHWPIIVFGRIALPDLSPLQFALVVVAGSIIAAALTYHLIEWPIRHGEFGNGKAGALAATACLVAAGASASLSTSGFEGRLDPQSSQITHTEAPDLNDLYLKGVCFLDPEQSTASYPLEKCFPSRHPVALLWGDSHAAHLYNGLKSEFEKAGYSLGMMASSACPPIVGYHVEGRPFCPEINDTVVSLIAARKPEIVILSALWKPFVMGQLAPTLELISKTGASIIVIGNTPIFQESVPLYLARPVRTAIKVSDRSAAELALQELLVQNKIANVRYISLKGVACPGGRCPVTDKSGLSYYLDEGHLSKAGSRWIASEIISDILSTRPPS
jgi:peptidoglycan/LPS O-acetylase OafA/YrhL